jgi:hypothetical protein
VGRILVNAAWFDTDKCLDEAEGVTVMVSEWLELDATDDWVRHDAEIVRS